MPLASPVNRHLGLGFLEQILEFPPPQRCYVLQSETRSVDAPSYQNARGSWIASNSSC